MAEYDAIVIGTGTAGSYLAERLARSGMKVAAIKRELVGGTCLNVGCTPTKTLVASAYAAHMPRRGCELGVQVDGPVAVDMKRVKARKDAVVAPRQAGLEAHDAHPSHRFGADSDNAGRAEAVVTLFSGADCVHRY
jgi:pyruvate/2-oxoglutarate dehydrogenase complex dihydrolipoamide dehydrogenase (E3) component